MRTLPLTVSAVTVTSAPAPASPRTARPSANGAAACAATISRHRRSPPGSAGSTGSKTVAAAGAWRAGTAATTGWPGSACSATAFSTPLPQRASVMARPHRARDGHVDVEHRRDRRCVHAARCRTAASRRPAAPDRPHAALAGRFRAARARARRHRRDRRDGVLVERQGVCAGRAADPRSASPMPPWSAASTRCAAACCSASIRWSWCRREPCRPFDADAPRHQHRRSGGLRAARARRTAGPLAARLRRIERRAPHVDAASRRPRRAARASRCARRAGLDADDDRLHQPARHGEPEERRSRSAPSSRDMFPARTHASSTKGWTGHTLGAAGFRRSGDQPAGARGARLRPGLLNTTTLDAACGPQIRRRTRTALSSPLCASNSFGFGGSNCVLAFGSGAPRPCIACVDGVAFWAQRLPGWDVASAVFAGASAAPAGIARRPRRTCCRRPNAGALRIPSRLRSRSRLGLARPRRFRPRNPRASLQRRTATSRSPTTCARTCSTSPLHTSPTRFHNSVHNAAAGYWCIAAGNHAPYTTISVAGYTFGAGLLEALTQLESQQRPVLFVAYDAEANGPLATLVSSRGLVGAGLLLSPCRGVSTVAELHWSLAGQSPVPITEPSPQNAPWVAGNAMASCLPLFEALARHTTPVTLAAGPALALHLEIR